MNVRKPNRTRNADADGNEMYQQKQSGDQHILPFDENDEAPHHPHRTSRLNPAVQSSRPNDVYDGTSAVAGRGISTSRNGGRSG